MKAKRGGNSAEVNNGSTVTLYVEGNATSIDKFVLENLLDIRVEYLGTSSRIRAVAESFKSVLPESYFIVDRDHFIDSEKVEESWKSFAEGKTNLLYWRKKEIESYFLDPVFLSQSVYAKQKVEDKIKKEILNYAKKYIFLYVAQYVFVTVREENKAKWVEIPREKDMLRYKNKKAALDELCKCPEIAKKIRSMSKNLSEERLTELFECCLNLFQGNAKRLKWGEGEWLSLMPAKKLLHELINNYSFFKNVEGGTDFLSKTKIIIKELLRHEERIPEDFKQLKRVLSERKSK